jgi:uncharacterized protein (UPF0333 family)
MSKSRNIFGAYLKKKNALLSFLNEFSGALGLSSNQAFIVVLKNNISKIFEKTQHFSIDNTEK